MFPFNNMRSTQTYLIHLFQEVVGLGRTLGPTGEDHQVHVPGGPDRRKSVKRNVGWDVHTHSHTAQYRVVVLRQHHLPSKNEGNKDGRDERRRKSSAQHVVGVCLARMTFKWKVLLVSGLRRPQPTTSPTRPR